MLALVAAVALAAPVPQVISASMQYGGITRTYMLVVPANDGRPEHPAPLIVVLHGHGGTARDAIGRYQFTAAAQHTGAIVLAPDGVNHGWNDGRTDWLEANTERIDDVGFITALVAQVRAHYAIDASRIGAAGMSNGAIFAQRLGCERAGLFTAIVSVAGWMPTALHCAPEDPVSVLLIAGTRDPLVPYDGGGVGFFHRRGDVLGAVKTFAFWRTNDACSAPIIPSALPTRANDGTSVSLQNSASCAKGTDVALYTVTGGGHAWPGESSALPTKLLGTSSANLDATTATTTFILSHPR